MQPYFGEKFGNPGSLHSFGQEAIGALDKARETIARILGADFRKIIFTGSATEANNLALRGAVRAFQKKHAGKTPRILISAAEHDSVYETARDLKREGVRVDVIPVNREGIVDVEKLKAMLSEDVVLVSVMYANNETGTIQPIAEIAKIISDFRGKNTYPLFHTDAVQALQFLDCNMETLGVDLATFSAHKIYGPKGVGALYVRGGKEKGFVSPVITGGEQEFGLRAGTENVPLAVGFAKALELIEEKKETHAGRLRGFRDSLAREIKKMSKRAEINGTLAAKHSLPNILNVYIPGKKAEDILMQCDRAGVAIGTGAACHARAIEPSRVIQALGWKKDRARESVRISFGRPTTPTDVAHLISILKRII